ncbi:uncharacterized protein J3D65DRAFT_664662 [Phyllosticta citribraziliensis]|uniref:Putative lipoate-protein ligase A n=1 Tax=Phyllosticta citribraziliensis TaxID=989973 RepID=A0ABR1M547_9PEZI
MPSLCAFRALSTASPTSSSTTSSREPTAAVSSLVAANPSRRSYIFVSTTSDPYLNLSIEAALLARSAAHTAILFTYINRPCVVIGRNQNPWVEVDLARLRRQRSPSTGRANEDEAAGEAAAAGILGDVDLVRRRSGGGAVFHDAGNVNWSVISPSNDFTRDKHGEMVVRALRGLGVGAARVNARHDIVVDHSNPQGASSKGDAVSNGRTPRKVSGSAYKLTRGRALHHGTCLLASPHLAAISQYLRAPAKPYIRAQGVESVRSPVANVGVDQTAFVEAVRREFKDMYSQDAEGAEDEETVVIEVGEEQLQDPEVKKGYEEMKTLDWTYLQTPRFTLSVPPESENDDEPAPQTEPTGLSPSTRIFLNVRHGVLEDGSTVSLPTSTGPVTLAMQQGRALHQIADWRPLLLAGASDADQRSSAVSPSDVDAVAAWLARMLPAANVAA